MRKLVLISGKAGSGKDTVGNMLYNQLLQLGYNSKILHFADDVKKIAIKEYSWNEKKDDKGRKLLQDIGDAGRNYDPYIWVNKVYSQLNNPENMDSIVIVPDTRYINEIDYVNIYNLNSEIPIEAITVRVRGNHGKSLNEIKSKSLQNHSSETELDIYKFQCSINNYSTIENLRDSVTELTKYITSK